MSHTQFTIVNGPSRDGLIDAFKYAYDEANRHICRFTLENEAGKTEVEAKIIEIERVTKIAHEDGSGYSFLFTCYYGTANSKLHIKANGYYNARSRRGWLQPTN